MRALLMSGLGPTYKNSAYTNGSYFEARPGEYADALMARAGHPDLTLAQLSFAHGPDRYPLLRRRRDATAHLTSFTLESILQTSGHDYIRLDLAEVWDGTAESPRYDVDVVLLSTTYIWNRRMMNVVLRWISTHVPGVPVVLGGQYTNLKYMVVLRDHPTVLGVVRGDGETALPMLLDTLAAGASLAAVPNLVWRDGDRVRINELTYIDLDGLPSPGFPGSLPVVPYESMRGCPFDCKFCSFPAASPKWRYKSAEKIRDDWMRYAEHNGAKVIEAMDSTFTVPPTRMRRLIELLPDAGVPWECYSRANVVTSEKFVEQLLAAHCFRLQIGFESMNEATLKRMSKRVTARQNRQAFELLSRSDLGYVVFFMVGYPGEGPDGFQDTRQFLLKEYSGYFMLHLFSVSDETMPLWNDREELQITVDDPDDAESAWSHVGMNSDEALRIQARTLDEVRLRNDDAVSMLWQGSFQHPLLAHRDVAANLAVEKAVERLAMAPKDFSDPAEGAEQVHRQLDQLERFGVRPHPVETLHRAPI